MSALIAKTHVGNCLDAIIGFPIVVIDNATCGMRA